MKFARNKNFLRSLLIFGYIAAVLLFSGLARADVRTSGTNGDLLDGSALISVSKVALANSRG